MQDSGDNGGDHGGDHGGDNGGPEDTKSSKLGDKHGVDHEVASRPTRGLRREALFVRGERQRIAVIAALCSLAGMSLGFGLGQIATTANSNCVHHETVRHVVSHHVPGPIVQQAQGYTWLGVEVMSARKLEGAIVTEVVSGSPAEEAGLEPGDVVVSFGTSKVMSSAGLVRAVQSHHPGQVVEITKRTSEGTLETLQTKLGTINRSELHQWQRASRR